eukprot:270189-Pyramimonas_sp.AAC.1
MGRPRAMRDARALSRRRSQDSPATNKIVAARFARRVVYIVAVRSLLLLFLKIWHPIRPTHQFLLR